MKDDLASLYVEQVLNEAQNKAKNKGLSSGKVEGAVKVGKTFEGPAKNIAKDTGPKSADGKIDEPVECTKNSSDNGNHAVETVGQPKLNKESKMDSEFDKIFNSIINEEGDPLDDVITDETGEMPADDEGGEEIADEADFEEQENDIIGRLTALRDEIDAIITDFSATEEGEEAVEGDEGMEDDGMGEEIPEDDFEESVTVKEGKEINGRPTPLGKKGQDLRKGQDIKGSKIKANKASAKIPSNKSSDGRPEKLNKTKAPDGSVIAQGPQGTKGSEYIK